MAAISSLAVKNNLTVLCDEAYFDITYGEKPKSFVSFPGIGNVWDDVLAELLEVVEARAGRERKPEHGDVQKAGDGFGGSNPGQD
ncbi:MAG: hypothetical protein E4H36_07980, partial [Spirochaetales bacterium]